VAPIITGIIVHFRSHIRCISIHNYYYVEWKRKSLEGNVTGLFWNKSCFLLRLRTTFQRPVPFS
jgi:hypothetical protein